MGAAERFFLLYSSDAHIYHPLGSSWCTVHVDAVHHWFAWSPPRVSWCLWAQSVSHTTRSGPAPSHGKLKIGVSTRAREITGDWCNRLNENIFTGSCVTRGAKTLPGTTSDDTSQIWSCHFTFHLFEEKIVENNDHWFLSLNLNRSSRSKNLVEPNWKP